MSGEVIYAVSVLCMIMGAVCVACAVAEAIGTRQKR